MKKAAGLGGVKGFYEGLPKKYSLPKKLLLNNFFNSLGKETCRFGNASAGAGRIYLNFRVFLYFS